MAQIGRRFDLRDRGEPDPRIRHVSTHDRAYLLAQQLVDAVSALGHPTSGGDCGA
jgi:hypothetical protein